MVKVILLIILKVNLIYKFIKFYKKNGLNIQIQNQWNEDTKNLFNKNGYVVIHDVLSDTECNEYRKTIMNIAKDEKLNGDAYFYGFHNKFQRIYNLINKIGDQTNANYFESLL